MLDDAVLDGEEQCDVMGKVPVSLSLNKRQNIKACGTATVLLHSFLYFGTGRRVG